MENAVCAGRDGLVPEYTSRADHSDRELHLLHCPDLHAGSMGAEQKRVRMACRHEECVLHIPGRMVRREVKRLENVVVVLDLRTLGHVVAELAENADNLLSGD